jgi:Ca-activated chloride channel family protein
MSFGAPGYLALLLLVPAGIAFIGAWAAWRAHARNRIGARIAPRRGAFVAPALLLLAIAFAAFAAARPQFGERSATVEDRGIDVVIVLDVSQSMFADDAQPTRLARAQAEVVALLDRMTGDRVGLVVFGGSAFVRAPMTSDLAALARIVDGVHQERGLVSPGSDLGGAIERAQRTLQGGEAETKVMLIISDGEDHGGLIATEVAAARAAGTIIYTAGAGTSAGSPVIDIDPETGERTERSDAAGAPVVTRLDAGALTRIADTGGGRYIELAGEGRPLAGLSSEFDALARTLFDTQERPVPVERFAIFAAVALACAVAATVASSSMPRIARDRARRLWPLAAAGLFVGAVCGTSVAELNREGNRSYDSGDYDDALAAYREAQQRDPSRAELYHNAGNALNLKDEYTSAIDETKRALASDSDDLLAVAEYALGNHYVGAEQLEEAIEAYKRALLIDPDDTDAKHNLEVILARLQSSPTPVPPTVTPPEMTPGAGEGEGSGSGEDGSPTPGADDASPSPGEPGSGTPAASDRDSTPEELERSLEEALRGIDEQFTVEEALRVLELLEEQNRGQLEAPRTTPGDTPDY